MKRIKCKIYRYSKRDEICLYRHESKTIDDLPEKFIFLVKDLLHVIDLELTSARKLAQEDVEVVMRDLEEQGYHWQMPTDPFKPNLYQGD